VDSLINDKESASNARTFFCEQGRGFFVFNKNICECLATHFIGSGESPGSSKVSPVLLDFFTFSIGGMLKDIYEKHEFGLILDHRIQNFKDIHVNKDMEFYDVVSMKLFQESDEKGTLLCMLPANSIGVSQ